MSLADLWNNELIILRKQWQTHHQSTLSGQFLLPAAALSYCSRQWRIMKTEHNNRGLFISVPLCLTVFVSLADALLWFLLLVTCIRCSFIGEDKLGRTSEYPKVIFWKGFFLLSCFPFQSVIVWSELKLYPPETVGSPFLDPTLFQPLAYQTELSPTWKFSDNSF